MTKRHVPLPAVRTRPCLLLGATVLATALSGGARAADLDVEIRGFADDIGHASVRLFGSRAAYKAGAADRQLAVPISARVAHLSLPDLRGTYALVVHHDRDGDGIVRALPFGLVLDPLGYSRSARGGMSRPAWEVVAFTPGILSPAQLIRLGHHPLVAFVQMLAVGLPALVAVFAGPALVRRLRTALAKPDPRKEALDD